MSRKKVKIDVYLFNEEKKEIRKRAKKMGLSDSRYMTLKSLDKLKEGKNDQ